MDIRDASQLQNYTVVSDINIEHGVRLVKEQTTGQLYVQKALSTYHLPVYRQLQMHPVIGIPGIHELFESDGHLIVIEEYISGENLEDQLARRECYPALEVRTIGLQLCDILIELESLNPPVIHRDIKPSNIIRSLNGSLTLLDLNAAKHENPAQPADTQLIGTQGFAAPEQYGFGPSLIQTDIYAVGMVMNAMLLGGPTRTVSSGSPLDPVIEKCLKMDPRDRYASAAELKNALLQTYSAIQGKKSLPVKPSKKQWLSFLPPGFRTLNPLHMILAVAVYAMIGIACSRMYGVGEYGDQMTWPTRITFLILCAAVIICTFNYRDVWRFFPLCKSQNRWVRILGVILFDVLAVVALFLICVTIISLTI